MPRYSIEEQLIRYRIEKKMAGRRDLLLHAVVYIAVAAIVLSSQPWLMNARDLTTLGALWTIPLILHGLRYYYRCGPGASRRADEIERAIDDQLERTGLDEEEEILIEDRIGKRITARRLVMAHGLTSALLFSLIAWDAWLSSFYFSDSFYRAAEVLLIAFVLHFCRFFFVHGRTPAGRALKIDAEVERAWHRSRQRSRERRAGYEAAANDIATNAPELGDGRGWLNDEGELELLVDEWSDSAQAGTGRA